MAEPAPAPPNAPSAVPVPPPPAINSAPRVSILDLAGRIGLPAVVIVIFLAIWQFVPPAVGLQDYELPTLTATLTGLQNDWGDIGTALLITLQDAMVGFLIGNGLAILGASVFAYSRNMERAFYPLAIVVQTIPILVYAPLLTIIFFKIPILSSNSQAAAVVGVAVLITFFPTLVNMNAGFKSIDPRVYELMRLLNASRTQIFLKLRFPSALPFLFSSLKITSTLAFVGALVGEYMVGGGFNPIGAGLDNAGVHSILGFATNPFNLAGVGYQMQLFYSRVDKPGIFADVLAVSVMSILFFGLMVLLERIFVPWQKSQ